MSRHKLYKHIIEVNLFNINAKRKRKPDATKKDKKLLRSTDKNR